MKLNSLVLVSLKFVHIRSAGDLCLVETDGIRQNLMPKTNSFPLPSYVYVGYSWSISILAKISGLFLTDWHRAIQGKK